MKNKVIGVYPLVGEITNTDIINDIDLIIDDYNILENLIESFINLNDDNELSDFILDNSIGNRLANVSYILKNLI